MSNSNLTKKDVFDFFMLGKKIVTSGAGAVIDAAKSRISQLNDSEEALQKKVAAQVKALVDLGFTQEEACKAVTDRMKDRVNRVVENITKPAATSAVEKVEK